MPLAESHVLSGLVKKRAVLDGELDYYQQKVIKLKKDIAALDATILVFEPEYNTRAIQKVKKIGNNRFFDRNTRSKTIYEVLRDAHGACLTVEELATEVIAKRELTLDLLERNALERTLLEGLNKLKTKGTIREASKVNGEARYALN